MPDEADTALYAIPSRRDRAGRIVVRAMVNGHGPFRFMLDTGSNYTVVAAEALPRLGLKADITSPILVSGVGGTELAPSAQVASLDAGDLHFHDLRLPVLSGPVLRGLDGILGMDGFDGLKLTADFIRDQTSISRSNGKRAAWIYSVVPVRFLSERLLLAQGSVAGVPVKAIIDTGSLSTLGNQALLAALEAQNRHHRQALVAQEIDATDARQKTLVARVYDVRLGAVDINTLEIGFGPFQIFQTWNLEQQPAMLIGMDLLGTLARLSIDYRRREVDMQPRDAPALEQRHWFSLTN